MKFTNEEFQKFKEENDRRIQEAHDEWEAWKKSLPVNWFSHLTPLKDENWFVCGTCGDRIAYKFECCGNSSCNGGGCDVCCGETKLYREIELRVDYGLHPLVMRYSPNEMDELFGRVR